MTKSKTNAAKHFEQVAVEIIQNLNDYCDDDMAEQEWLDAAEDMIKHIREFTEERINDLNAMQPGDVL